MGHYNNKAWGGEGGRRGDVFHVASCHGEGANMPRNCIFCYMSSHFSTSGGTCTVETVEDERLMCLVKQANCAK